MQIQGYTEGKHADKDVIPDLLLYKWFLFDSYARESWKELAYTLGKGKWKPEGSLSPQLQQVLHEAMKRMYNGMQLMHDIRMSHLSLLMLSLMLPMP